MMGHNDVLDFAALIYELPAAVVRGSWLRPANKKEQ
jgi:hypothetical protein